MKHIHVALDNISLKQINYNHTKLNVSDLVLRNPYDLIYKVILKTIAKKNSSSPRSAILSEARHIEIISTKRSTDEVIE